MVHGYFPSEFKAGVTTPVVKDYRKSLLNADNYGPVTIISVLSKFFEMCLSRRIYGLLNLDGVQLGFVAEGGCDKSLFTVSNVVNYYLKRCSDVYLVAMDATVAFGRVNTNELLTKLIDGNIPFKVVRALLNWYTNNWYTNSSACEKMQGLLTDYITINSGVKHGSILSPMFYKIYVDDLMKELMHASLGCTIGGLYYSTIFYADDIVLFGASVDKMKRILKLCCDYCHKFDICINPSKSKWLCADVHIARIGMLFLK